MEHPEITMRERWGVPDAPKEQCPCECGLNTGDVMETVCNHLVCEDCKITCEVCGELVCPACVVTNDEADKLCGGECLTIINEERKVA